MSNFTDGLNSEQARAQLGAARVIEQLAGELDDSTWFTPDYVQNVQVYYIGIHLPWWFAVPINMSSKFPSQ